MREKLRDFRTAIVGLKIPGPLQHSAHPRGLDVLVWLVPLFVVTLVAGVLLGFNAYEIHQRVLEENLTVNSLKENQATRQYAVEELAESRTRAQSERNLPHPTIQDRDTHFVGTHATVSWTYDPEENGKYISYEIELTPLELFTDPGWASTLEKTCENYLPAEIRMGVRFIATDPGNRATRIPPQGVCDLPPGEYAWRVAAVPVGTQVQQGERDEPKRLSLWSGYAKLSLDASLAARIIRTKRVRVGVNLEQNTLFAMRNADGSVNGFEPQLVHKLIDDCLQVNRDTKTLASKCKVKDFPELTGRPPNLSPVCTSHCSDCICSEFVPIEKWGGWQTALHRKEIDVFVGSVTRAADRERSGVRFTQGYLTYQSRLYTHPWDQEPGQNSLASWLRIKRTVGVIADSSDEKLLNAIRQHPSVPGIASSLNAERFASFPQIEDAMDQGQIDGVLIDDTFVDHENWKHLPDLRFTERQAWRSYRDSFLGYGDEQVAMPIAEDIGSDQPLFDLIHYEFNLPVLPQYLVSLCRQFWTGSPESGFRCELTHP